MMSSPRSKGQRKKPKFLPESDAMQSQVESFAGTEERTNGHSAVLKDQVYEELFTEAQHAVRNGASTKKSKPGPLSRKLKLDKKKPSSAAPVEPQIVEPQIVEPQIVEPQIVEPQIVPQIAETNGNGVPPVEAEELQNPQVAEPRIFEPAAPTEFPPTELFEPSAQEPFPEYPETSAFDDSFASTQIFTADQSVTHVEICVSPSAFPLDASKAPSSDEDPTFDEAPPLDKDLVEDPPAEEPVPAKEIAAPKETVHLPRTFRETPKDYRSFLSVSSRPSIHELTPTTSTPQSFLRGRDDPSTPFVSVFGGLKRKAESSPICPTEGKRVKAAEGLFSRVTAPLYRVFAAKEGRGEEDEGIEAGEEAVEAGDAPRKYCAVM